MESLIFCAVAKTVAKKFLSIPEIHEKPLYDMFQINKNASLNNTLLLVLFELPQCCFFDDQVIEIPFEKLPQNHNVT